MFRVWDVGASFVDQVLGGAFRTWLPWYRHSTYFLRTVPGKNNTIFSLSTVRDLNSFSIVALSNH